MPEMTNGRMASDGTMGGATNNGLPTDTDNTDDAPQAGEEGDRLLGLVGAPAQMESTSGTFYFWVERGKLAERMQLVKTKSRIGGQDLTFYGVTEEVYRRSRKRSMDEEVDAFDGDPTFDPPFKPEGVTFAKVTILATEPPLLTPPLEQSAVVLGGEAEAKIAYGYTEMVDDATGDDWGLPIGILRNGGAATAGVAKIDLRDLCGDRAGHLNVTGQAGRGTKSSFLLFLLRMLLDFVRRRDNGDPSRAPFSVRPVVFNVKGNDLMYIDTLNRGLTAEKRKLWETMGVAEPCPFADAEFYAPCAVSGRKPERDRARVLREVAPKRQTKPYYYTLADIIRFGLWSYLFSEDVQQSESMMALVEHLLDLLAEDCPIDADHPLGMRLRTEQPRDIPQSFTRLREWMEMALNDSHHVARANGTYAHGTMRALLTRLGLVLGEAGRSIFSDEPGHGRPLSVCSAGTTDPLVIDIATLPTELRRFVVAAVLDQVKEQQLNKRISGQIYLLVLDELGIYAPRGARDPITRLFEHVAAQLRSQGIILLGAQQQASKVSETIFGNSEFKVLGASSPVELESPTWSHLLTSAQKARALVLRPEEKMILGGHGWMNVLVPYPAWAMKEGEVDKQAMAAGVDSMTVSAEGTEQADQRAPISLNLPED